MELIEKLKEANAEVFILDYYVGPDELGESHTGTQTFTSFNGFDNVTDYKEDLFNAFVDLYDEIMYSGLSKFDILERLHETLNELKIVEFVLIKKVGPSGIPYISHKNFKGSTDSNNPEYLENNHFDIQEYLNTAYEIYEMTVDRINGLIKTFESINDESTPVIDKQTKITKTHKKIFVNTGVSNLLTLFWMLDQNGILDTSGMNLFRFIQNNFHTVGTDEPTLNSLKTKYGKIDHTIIDYWNLKLLLMRDSLTKIKKKKS